MQSSCRLFLGLIIFTFWTAPHTSERILQTAVLAASQQNEGHRLLHEADRTAFLHNWAKAEISFRKAEVFFQRSGDVRNQTYAHVGRLRGTVETLSLPTVSAEIGDILKTELAQTDLQLRLLCLVSKGDIDFQIDPKSSKRLWEEVESLAQKVDQPIWKNRARAELGTIAFYDGEIFRAMHMIASAYVETERQHDSAWMIRDLAAFGEGFADLGRNEDARRFFERSIRLAEATPDAEVPFTAHLGKAKILIALNQRAEGKAMLDRLLQEACSRGMQVREARLRIVLGDFAEKNGDRTEAITHFERLWCKRRRFWQ